MSRGGVLFRREADTLPHASQISLGDCKTFPLAFLLLQVTTEVEGIRLTRPISVEIHTESVLPRALPTVASASARHWSCWPLGRAEHEPRTGDLSHRR